MSHKYRHPALVRRATLFGISTLLLGTAAHSLAQQPGEFASVEDPNAPALWEFRLAAFGRYAPVYPAAGESDLTILPIPIPVYRGSFLSFGENLDQVARGDIVDNRRIRFGIDLDFTFGEDSQDIEARRGMPDLDFMFEIGPELEIKLNNRTPEQGEFFLAVQLRAGVSLDGIDPSSRGFVYGPQLEYRRDQVLGSDTLLSLRFKPTWANEKYMDYYYEVEPAFATAGRSAFDASSGYLGSKLTAALTRQINDRLIFGVSASLWLHEGAENDRSPLFRSDTGASIQAALVWTLAESEKRARTRSER